ncbi:MAG: Lrp/AsnC family transcriptional regulator [Ruminococcaceae bacterium]|nr:Lrp/AsnC family transcriptional regulator [Oscillospiraceae bacterium]
MDSTDYKILSCLKENSRMNATAIGDRINLSTSAVLERIKKLETSKVIVKYTTVIDNEKIGKGITVFISVSLEHPKFDESFREVISQNDEIVECHYVTGDYDYMLKGITASSKTLEDLINCVKSIKGVSHTKTLVVMTTTKNDFTTIEG